MIISLSHTPHQVWNPCEHVAPSIFVRLECYVHGAIIQFPGPRQFYMSLAAFAIGAIGFSSARLSAQASKKILTSIAIVAALYCIIVQLGIFLDKETFLPKELGKSEFGKDRFALIITNPGWVWPYLSPGLAVIFWQILTSRTWLKRVLGLIGAIIIIAGIFQTKQRGGLLLITTLASISGLYLIIKNRDFFRTHKVTTILLSLTSISAFCILAPHLYQFVLNKIGRSEFLDENRLTIWKIALPHILDKKPLWGFGYASWFQEYRSIVIGKSAPLYDTAHNLFVQMVFEHGILGALLVLAALVFMLFLTVKNLKSQSSGKLLGLLATATFVCVTIVQEIDYIRPTYYMHALFWGTLLGLRTNPINTKINERITIFNRETKSIQFSKTSMNTALSATAAVALSIGVVVAIYFPFGLYPFEGDLSKKSENIERWMGPLSRLNTYGNRNAWEFQIRAPQSMKLFATTSKKKCMFDLKTGDLQNIQIKNVSKWIPSVSILRASDFQPDGCRYISTRLVYPPKTTLAPQPETLSDNNNTKCF